MFHDGMVLVFDNGNRDWHFRFQKIVGARLDRLLRTISVCGNVEDSVSDLSLHSTSCSESFRLSRLYTKLLLYESMNIR